MYKKIILAYDGSASGQQALLGIQELAHWAHPQLTLLAVMPSADMEVGTIEMGYIANTHNASLEKALQEQLHKGVKTLRSMGFDATGEVLRGEVIREIAHYAKAHACDLIVIGHKHEKNLLRRWWTGSTAKSLVEESPCNVLIVVDR